MTTAAKVAWFEPRSAARTSPLPVLTPELPEQTGVLPCPEPSRCATCRHPLFEREPVRPAHEPSDVLYDCLTCWWRIEFDRSRVAA